MACVVSPFDQRFPVAADEVRMTLPPSQKVVVPVTVKVPEAEIVIDCVVAPLDHVFPVAADEVKTTLPPVHKVVVPDAVTVGVAGNGLTVTVTAADGAESHPPLL